MSAVSGGVSPIALHAGPGVGFEAPFEMLEACHQRVHRMLGLLERLTAHLASHGTDESARQAARDVMRYFDQAGPAHHEDEERHILPRLRTQGRATLAERLHADHEAMAQGWAAVRADLVDVAEGRWTVDASSASNRRWAAFAALYREHIVVEENEAYPAAREVLDSSAEQAMGREMAVRRGVLPAD